MNKPPPKNLQTRGQALWISVVAEQDFDAAGYALLEDACRTADIIDRLQGMLNQDEEDWLLISEGKSTAQAAAEAAEREKRLVLNIRPLLGEIRQQRLAMNRLMNQLGIGKLTSDDDTESKQSQSFWEAKEKEFEEG